MTIQKRLLVKILIIPFIKKYPNLTIDLFASQINHKLEKYVVCRPDLNTLAIGAFTMTWNNGLFIFHLFSFRR